MIVLFSEKNECCGCTACMAVCPVGAIAMSADAEGFLYPLIDRQKCIECGKCLNVCAFRNGCGKSKDSAPPDVYAGRHRNEEVRGESTSGGAFTALSDCVLGLGGVIYGVALDAELNVLHQRADSASGRDKFRGSKYVQSDMRGIYQSIKADLEAGRRVLFTGTPCQCGGLQSYIGKDLRDNLIICDIICHGTPSPLIWKEHVKYIQNRSRSQIRGYRFRSKVNGWHSHTECALFVNGKQIYRPVVFQAFKELFYMHLMLRPACHSCPYTNLRRPSDITIADFWGIENVMPELDDNRGVSLILVNTPAGRELFDMAAADLAVFPSDPRSCLQPQLVHPAAASPNRDCFWMDYHKKGYAYISKKYAHTGFSGRFRRMVSAVLSALGLKPVIRKIMGKP